MTEYIETDDLVAHQYLKAVGFGWCRSQREVGEEFMTKTIQGKVFVWCTFYEVTMSNSRGQVLRVATRAEPLPLDQFPDV